MPGGKEPNALRGIETHHGRVQNLEADRGRRGKEPNALRGIETMVWPPNWRLPLAPSGKEPNALRGIETPVAKGPVSVDEHADGLIGWKRT